MALTIRFWDFDMDSAVLGPIRCAHLDATKKFNEFEDSIRNGTVDSTALARDVFQTVARKRTGDAEIDARCRGDKFSEEEVSTLPLDELDQFCDKLVKGRLRLVATATGAEPPPAAPVITPGREGLAAALLHAAEKSRAAMKRTLDAAERSSRAASVFDDQRAALGGNAAERAMREIWRSEELVRGAMGTEDLLKSAIGQTSMTAATEAMLGIGRNRDMIKVALGIDDRVKSFLDQTSVSAAAQTLAGIGRSEDIFKGSVGITDHMKSLLGPTSMSSAAQTLAGIGRSEYMFKGLAGVDEHMKSLLGPPSMSAATQALADIGANLNISRAALGIDDHINTVLGDRTSTNAVLEAIHGTRSLEESAHRFANTARPIVPTLASMGSQEVLPVLPAPLLDVTPYRMIAPPPNPIDKTNEMVEELLAHQKAEAGKKDADRSEAAIESADNKRIAKSGLFHTKASVWVGLIAFVVPMTWGVWVYVDAKADALETEKKTEVQLEKLRAEIRALKVSKPAAVPASPPPVTISPVGHAGDKPR